MSFHFTAELVGAHGKFLDQDSNFKGEKYEFEKEGDEFHGKSTGEDHERKRKRR